MVLNRLPKFKSSKPKPSAAEGFGTLRPTFEQTQKSSIMQSSIPNFNIWDRWFWNKIFFLFSYVFLCFKPRSPWREAILDHGTFIWTNLVKGH